MTRQLSLRVTAPLAVLAALVTGVAVASVAVLPRSASATESATPTRKAPVRVSTIDVDGNDTTAFVRVRGWKDPTFTVFRLDHPDRVVVDLRNADLSELSAKGALTGKGPVLSVTPSHIADEKASVGRIVIAVTRDARYDVHAEGNDLIVEIRSSAASNAPVARAPVETKPASAAPAPGTDAKVVRVEVDRLPGDVKSGTRLTEARLLTRGKSAVLSLQADGPVASYQIVELKEPGRLALDLDGFERGVKPRETSAGPVSALRIARHDGRVRVVLEAKGDRFPPFEITRTVKGLEVKVNEESPAAVASTESRSAPAAVVVEAKAEPKTAEKKAETKVVTATPVEAPKAVAAKPAEAAPVVAEKKSVESVRPVNVESIDISGAGRMSRIILALTDEVQYEEQKLADGTHALVLRNARLPKALARRLDATALEGPVAWLASYAEAADGSVRLVTSLKGHEAEAESTVALHKVVGSTALEWKFTGVAPRKLMAANTTGVQSAALRTRGPGGFMGEAPAYAQSAGPRAAEGKYSGKRVDFTAKDLDILQFLNAIAEVAKRNIVADEGVAGRVTVRLRNVPWDEALDIVLRTKNLDRQEVGSIIRVAPLKVLADEAEAAAKAAEARLKFAPLKVRLIPVNYTTADSLAGQLKDLLTPERGTLSIDSRTNVLIVKDTQEVLAKAELLVRNLDLPTPQVLIEARIVEASTSFSRSIGIQWGGDVKASPATGNPTGLVFPNLISVAGAADDGRGGTSGTASKPNFVVNMPTSVGAGSGGGLGFIFGSAGGAANLNLRLTAAEIGGTIKTVSAPKAVTLDNQPATISQGVSIPYLAVGAAGSNVAFIDARLALSVTPHVTADGSVLLQISVTNNQPNTAIAGAGGQPSLLRREANTRVLVKDGDTTVIGGIYTRRTSMTGNEVPFFGKIPILGALFRQNNEADDRTEMLIFISPRIINRQQSVVTQGDVTGLESGK
jgi:type IV pilus assembly protein PilQ